MASVVLPAAAAQEGSPAGTNPWCGAQRSAKASTYHPSRGTNQPPSLREDGAVGELCLGSLQHVATLPTPNVTWKSSLPASSQQALQLCSSRLSALARGQHQFTPAENPTHCVTSPSCFVIAVKIKLGNSEWEAVAQPSTQDIPGEPDWVSWEILSHKWQISHPCARKLRAHSPPTPHL